LDGGDFFFGGAAFGEDFAEKMELGGCGCSCQRCCAISGVSMRRPNIIIGILAVVLCGVFAAMFWPEKPEPVYKGRKLSEWLLSATNSGVFAKAEIQAIQAIGTNGIPYYLKWIRYRPGFLKRTQFRFAPKCRDWFHVKWYPDLSGVMRGHYAYLALGELGEPAAPAFLGFVTNSSLGLTNYLWPVEAAMGIDGLAGMGDPVSLDFCP
jgi:hypothetical protein